MSSLIPPYSFSLNFYFCRLARNSKRMHDKVLKNSLNVFSFYTFVPFYFSLYLLYVEHLKLSMCVSFLFFILSFSMSNRFFLLFARQKCFQLILPFRDEAKNKRRSFQGERALQSERWKMMDRSFFLLFGFALKSVLSV